jgi:hypothetical protein
VNGRRYSAGQAIEDLCRVCKSSRAHTVVAADTDGRPLRVTCDYCGSQHNYRGGERAAPDRSAAGGASPDPAASTGELVTERERRYEPMSAEIEGGGPLDLELLLRRVLREETGVSPVAPAARWRGGEMILRPGREGTQEKTVPLETFFAKIVAIRNRLRTLEQQINASDLPEDVKLKLQGYVTACYGSLTTFNVLFADEEDRFRGSSG